MLVFIVSVLSGIGAIELFERRSERNASGECLMEALRLFPKVDEQSVTNFIDYRRACMAAKGYE